MLAGLIGEVGQEGGGSSNIDGSTSYNDGRLQGNTE